MAINFFDPGCHTSSSRMTFGLCDDPPPDNHPAYIDEFNPGAWIAQVENSDQHQVDFYAIDNCVTVTKPDGNMESRCDGLLRFDNNLIFVELKNREGSGWLSKGRKQLTTTINIFSRENQLTDFDRVEAYVCNSLRPLANQGNAVELQKFTDDTGLLLQAQQKITI